MTSNLIEAYIALLKIPINHEWRATNQHLYVELRDAIAERTNQSSECIQETFEQYVIIMREAK